MVITDKSKMNHHDTNLTIVLSLVFSLLGVVLILHTATQMSDEHQHLHYKLNLEIKVDYE